MKNTQFVKVACISPRLVVGDPMTNVQYFIDEINQIKAERPEFIVFPELATIGYTVGDLLFQSYLLKKSNEAIHYFLKHNPSENIVIIGAPILYQDQLYNCGVVVLKDRVIGIVPKMYLPNYNEFYEKRYFVSGFVLGDDTVYISEFDAPMGVLLFKELSKSVTFGVEVCEDLHAPVPPNTYLSISGAEIIFNLSASNATLGKDELRRYMIQATTRRNHSAYVYVSSGRHESTQDTVFSSHNLICEEGTMLNESNLFDREASVILADIDMGYLKYKRRKSSTLKDSLVLYRKEIHTVTFNCHTDDSEYKLQFPLNETPFVPDKNIQEKFSQIRDIQVMGLAKRVEHVNVKTLLVGLSGGLDSTLALLIAYHTFKFLGKDPKDIIAITMPGFGTSDRTKNNAKDLALALGVTFETISIKDSVLAHFIAIGHDVSQLDVTYENAQARERTNILMNLANKHHGLVVGTGDLSELALGWTTFNGDHMSNYSVNGGLPKTLVSFMVKSFADFTYQDQQTIHDTLYDILDTPISPELVGNDQQTEKIIGKYEVNDFILYRMLVRGDDEERIKYLLKHVFRDTLTDDDIDHYIRTFYKRFFSQQFKRSTLPDGPKVIDISLSPRTDFRMPSDAGYIK